MHMSKFSKLNTAAAAGSRLVSGMGPLSQISTPSLGLLGNAASPSSDYGMQLLRDLGIDAANITNQVFIANVRVRLYRLIV